MPDSGPMPDAMGADAAHVYTCTPMNLTAPEICAVALTGQVQACSIQPMGTPSSTGWLEVSQPDGTHGYLCATGYDPTGGYYFVNNPDQLVASSATCCNGTSSSTLDWPAVDPDFGIAHGPTHVKPWEQMATPSGMIRQNPFAVIVSSTDAGASFDAARTQWLAWAGDGQPHPAPDGSGDYYFPSAFPINYVIVPTTTGNPLLVIGPEVSRDSSFSSPEGHPTLGACAVQGGTPFAFMGGEVHGDVITNHSGRFGNSSISEAMLENAKTLFNCYGINITDIQYLPNN